MSRERKYLLLKSVVTYKDRLKEFDSFDIEIIKMMIELGPRNVSNVARVMREPQQTLSYRVNKWDSRQLVLFKAVIDENKLGLVNLITFIKPKDSGEFKYLIKRALLAREIGKCEGAVNGYFIRFSVPMNKVEELRSRMKYVAGEDSEFIETTTIDYANLNLDFYSHAISELRRAEISKVPLFDWSAWLKDIDNFPEANLVDMESTTRAEYDEFDLFILSQLSEDARKKFVDIARELASEIGDENYKKYIVLISRRYHQRILLQGLVKKYIAVLMPNTPDMIYLVSDIVFPNGTILRKFVSALSAVPYLTAYFKVIGEPRLILRSYLPIYEIKNVLNFFKEAEEIGLYHSYRFSMINPENYIENNALYRAYRGGTWNLFKD
ncbi:MAG: hypothetical protein DRJ40_07460 [Thermoprotei archaeon]|nr:MAG: hypothetical protein DRJ40_07460 [Thermoprotei archaeon]